ncbi:acyl-CoA dehydrogenase family protein [Kitasatospora sp. NPDC018058]|uniref:acyl-CoA dehydrogenase family protein n=1 Tax=Kitasatospora sp. NPDC018058 TaxID=3364025 RepID=UPI0037BE8B2F
MDHLLTAEERQHHSSLVKLVGDTWGDEAASWERDQSLPEHVVRWCAEQGLMGAALPRSAGGGGWSAVETGLMYEALGRVSASLGSLVNVHGMMAQTVLKWGTEQQRRELGPALASGDRVAAICMTEPHAGSDLAAITTSVAECDGRLVLDGAKVFITFGGRADVFLVFGKRAGRSVACLVERDNPGVTIRPMGEALGLRAAALARVEFRDCVIEPEALVGRDDFALSVLVPLALEHGRHAVAWMATGMLRASFDTCASFAAERRAFDRTLVEHGQVQSLLARMATDLEAAGHLCAAASRALDAGDPAATERVLMAKYFACRAAEEHTAQAVQLLGSAGVLESTGVARHYRDSKILNILEGTTQILERQLAPRLAHAARRSG